MCDSAPSFSEERNIKNVIVASAFAQLLVAMNNR